MNLREAAEHICVDAGFRRGIVRVTLGSIVGPTFVRDGGMQTLPGVCGEIVSIMGSVGPDSEPDSPLHILVGDITGAVHGGIIDPATSLVAITTELADFEADS